MEKKLSAKDKKHLRDVVSKHQGMGFFDDVGAFFKKVVNDPTVRSIASTVGPVVLEKFLIPMLQKKMGAGLSLPGQGLKLAGQGKKKARFVKGSPEAKAYMAKVRAAKK